MPEFTGERVIPGLVDCDLFNEHLSRYRFAASFVKAGMKVLDAGCGVGYGAAELAKAGFVAGVDLSREAAAHAAENYARANTAFAAASCAALPFADDSFDLVVAFEVIEHLEDYRALLKEAQRVLAPGGILLVSTPNRAYYAESRGEAGPNPFHVHEFRYSEFFESLARYFVDVEIWTQNHTDTIVFAPAAADTGLAEAAGDPDFATANFFVAACSDVSIPRRPLFAWIPSEANTLRERELHIARLQAELATKNAWLQDALARHQLLQNKHEELLGEFAERTQWAEDLNRQLSEQTSEVARRDALILKMQEEAEARLNWVHDLEEQIARGRRQIESLDSDLAARAEWARSLDAEVERYRAEMTKMRAQIDMAAQSRWLRLGRKLGVGPNFNEAGSSGE